ncbi:VPLPA-CTERM sorting domain-containing protein [Methylomonas sp. MgM2]
MKTSIFTPQNTGIALALSLCFAYQALAAADYDSSVDLSYSIAVLDSTNPTPGDNTGLTILGTYQQPGDDSSFYVTVSGDGDSLAYSPNPASSAVAGIFTGSFTATGSAVSGSVDSLHTGLFGLEFANNGPYSYNLAVNLTYALQASAHGEFANSAILFDYWDETGAISGFDYASAATFTDYLDDRQSASDSVIWLFTLTPGATQQLYAQAGITSHLESANAAAVPLPAAAWLFGSAVAGFGFMGRRKGAGLERVGRIAYEQFSFGGWHL